MGKAVTTDEYLEGVRRNLARAATAQKEIGKVVANIHARKVRQVFTDGIKGTKYSNKPTLAGSNVFGNRNKFGGMSYTFATKAGSQRFFGSKAKMARAEWRKVITGKGARNLMVIPNGYRQIRVADGRPVNRVNLTHTGQLFKDYATSLSHDGWIWRTGVRRNENVGKIQGALSKYGPQPFLVGPTDISDDDLARLGAAMADLLVL